MNRYCQFKLPRSDINLKTTKLNTYIVASPDLDQLSDMKQLVTSSAMNFLSLRVHTKKRSEKCMRS